MERGGGAVFSRKEQESFRTLTIESHRRYGILYTRVVLQGLIIIGVFTVVLHLSISISFVSDCSLKFTPRKGGLWVVRISSYLREANWAGFHEMGRWLSVTI